MGVGNLTELTDADTTGINAMLFGMIAELNVNAVLATSVSPHAINAVAEADVARRIMLAAHEDKRLPRDYSNGLLGLHDRRPFTYTSEEIQALAAQVKDPNFRIQISEQGVHIYNRNGLHSDIDPFRLYPMLDVDEDGSHAFYLGVELARAQIAWQLKKRYSQDEELQWGCNTAEPDSRGRTEHREAALEKKNVNADGSAHVAPFGIREQDDRVLIAPFRPSTSLDNFLRTGNAVVNLTDDVRLFAGGLTGRREWAVKPSAEVSGWVLEGALAHRELVLDEVEDDATRPSLWFKIVHEENHAPFRGFNRAQAAVIEAAVLVSRLHMLPMEKIETELKYLAIAIDKTAGERELQAWGWLMERIMNFKAEQTGGNQA
ncbi:conserved hypothetical protein [Ricinus communis]|uniref:Uncharacterized protein n=1 Tax=Ricinus communis TaxID=3988 RepID=B9TAC9_RICCO|nr:conserved hypothetical protein [Ricinus communis]